MWGVGLKFLVYPGTCLLTFSAAIIRGLMWIVGLDFYVPPQEFYCRFEPSTFVVSESIDAFQVKKGFFYSFHFCLFLNPLGDFECLTDFGHLLVILIRSNLVSIFKSLNEIFNISPF